MRYGLILAVAAGCAWGQAFADAEKSLSAYTKAELTPAKSCAEAGAYKGSEIVKIAASEVPATTGVPAYCKVVGVISPEVAFEVSMPAKWSGRFYMIGNGGHAGDALDGQGRATERNGALRMGFAFAQTNTGHYSADEPGGSFILSNPQKAIDYAYRAVHVTAVATKAITELYYGRKIAKAYWNSCSNGGRQGMMEAQRYPEDFDGVMAGAPWVDQAGFAIGAVWNEKWLTEAGVTAEKLPLLADRVMAVCDEVDGLKDGLIDDPRKCKFDAKRDIKACTAGQNGADCFTAAQAEAVMKVYSGPQSKGKTFFPGFMLGSEQPLNGRSNWVGMLVGQQAGARPAVFNLGDNTLKYLMLTTPNANWDYKTLDYEKAAEITADWAKKANAVNPDLAAFSKKGGKIIMTYGWADQILQPMMGVNYYETAVKKNAKTPDFMRLFVVPGMGHCSGGIGAGTFDAMTALIDWVEKGKAPDSLLGSKVVSGKVERTRPLCPYPKVAKYSGKGSIDEAANFSCKAP